jgi:hypothetical protein
MGDFTGSESEAATDKNDKGGLFCIRFSERPRTFK